MRNSSASPIGAPSFTKYGSPTVICLSWSACTSSGKTVPGQHDQREAREQQIVEEERRLA